MDPLNVLAKFEIRNFTRSCDNRGYPSSNKLGQYAMPPFLQNFNGLLFGWTLLLFWPNLKFVALPVPEIAIEVLGGGCEPPVLGKRRPRGLVWYVPFNASFQRYCRFCAPARHFSHPTSRLPKRCWLIVRAIRFPTYRPVVRYYVA